ncbi:hypothetical protein BJ684DRAFT_21229 [Piptocephalis cylindrospora]|uniref:Rap-GAP domain-containing protein n=1 Tax=Piptocephalis cylindrospora TaxID=1907219 RepID=A0A4P9Y0H0_9FUNG|nr:hypothetical protein BJ684DRAFT_21229 [Piptocephalis cylindrospora]|eukprot:RKP12217.1 hypothetical protein BJ684DRAFT_21229 [Piptocephalis cylindrospora]
MSVDGYNARLEVTDHFALFAWKHFIPLIGSVDGLSSANFHRIVLGMRQIIEAFQAVGQKSPSSSAPPPTGNTLLRLLGDWLLSACVAYPTSPSYNQGRVEAYSAVCLILTQSSPSSSSKSEWDAGFVERFLEVLAHGLRHDTTLPILLLESPDLFASDLPGLRSLIPDYLTALSRILPRLSPDFTPRVPLPRLRLAAIQLTACLLCIPNLFATRALPPSWSYPKLSKTSFSDSASSEDSMEALVVSLLRTLYDPRETPKGGDTSQPSSPPESSPSSVLVSSSSTSSTKTYYHLKSVLMEMLVCSLTSEVSSYNLRYLLHLIAIFVTEDVSLCPGLVGVVIKAISEKLLTFDLPQEVTLTALASLHQFSPLYPYVAQDSRNCARELVLSICRFLGTMMAREHLLRNVRVIARAYECLMAWILVGDWILGDADCLRTVIATMDLGLAAQDREPELVAHMDPMSSSPAPGHAHSSSAFPASSSTSNLLFQGSSFTFPTAPTPGAPTLSTQGQGQAQTAAPPPPSPTPPLPLSSSAYIPPMHQSNPSTPTPIAAPSPPIPASPPPPSMSTVRSRPRSRFYPLGASSIQDHSGPVPSTPSPVPVIPMDSQGSYENTGGDSPFSGFGLSSVNSSPSTDSSYSTSSSILPHPMSQASMKHRIQAGLRMVGEAAEAASTRLVRHLGTVDQGTKADSGAGREGNWWADGRPSRWEGEGQDTADLEKWLLQRKRLVEASREQVSKDLVIGDHITLTTSSSSSSHVDLTSLGPVPVQYYLIEDHLILGISLLDPPSSSSSSHGTDEETSLKLRVVTRDVTGKSVWRLAKTLGLPSSVLRERALSTSLSGDRGEWNSSRDCLTNDTQGKRRDRLTGSSSPSTMNSLFQDVGDHQTHPELSFPIPGSSSKVYYDLFYPSDQEDIDGHDDHDDANGEDSSPKTLPIPPPKAKEPGIINPSDLESGEVERLLLAELGFMPDLHSAQRILSLPTGDDLLALLKDIDHTYRENLCLSVTVLYAQSARETSFPELLKPLEAPPAELTSFVESLGWMVQVGNHPGFTGMLDPSVCREAAYFSDQEVEVIYHTPALWNPCPSPETPVDRFTRITSRDRVCVLWVEEDAFSVPQLLQHMPSNFIICIILQPLRRTPDLFVVRIGISNAGVQGRNHLTAALVEDRMSIGPLVDGMVISKHILGSVTRNTIISAHKTFLEVSQDEIVNPLILRRNAIQRLSLMYQDQRSLETLYENLLGASIRPIPIPPPHRGSVERCWMFRILERIQVLGRLGTPELGDT